MTTNLDLELDLDAQRTARMEARGVEPGVTLGGRRLTVPVELPLDVLQPLTGINMDITLLLRQLLDTRAEQRENAEQGAQQEQMLSALVDTLVTNPRLPSEVITAAKTMARELFGEEQYEHLVSCRPSLQTLSVLVKWLFRLYGVGLGEASPSSDSSEDTGETSKATSSSTTTSTSGRSTTGRGRGRAS